MWKLASSFSRLISNRDIIGTPYLSKEMYYISGAAGSPQRYSYSVEIFLIRNDFSANDFYQICIECRHVFRTAVSFPSIENILVLKI